MPRVAQDLVFIQCGGRICDDGFFYDGCHNVPACTATKAVSIFLEASGDGGDDRYRIAFLGGSILFLQIANILVIYVHVDEGAQLAVIGVEMAAQVAILCCEIGQGFSDGAALNVNRRVFAGILPEWGGNMNLHDRALIITRMRSASPRIPTITTD